MSAEVEFAAFTLAAPLAAAVATAMLVARLAPQKLAERYALGAALAAGFAVGYWLLPDWAPLTPQQHWHWLPYVGAAALVAAIGLAEGVSLFERWLALALFALVAAWQLVPAWPDLSPPRTVLVSLLAGYFVLVSGLLAALPERLLGRTFVALLTASAAATAVLVGLGVSLKYGQVTAAAAAATAGCFAASFFLHRRPATIRGLIPVFTVLAGGSAFIGAIEPMPPQPIVLVSPAAPLVLWLFACGPLARLQGAAAVAAQSIAVALPLVAAIAWTAVGQSSALSYHPIQSAGPLSSTTRTRCPAPCSRLARH